MVSNRGAPRGYPASAHNLEAIQFIQGRSSCGVVEASAISWGLARTSEFIGKAAAGTNWRRDSLQFAGFNLTGSLDPQVVSFLSPAVAGGIYNEVRRIGECSPSLVLELHAVPDSTVGSIRTHSLNVTLQQLGRFRFQDKETAMLKIRLGLSSLICAVAFAASGFAQEGNPKARFERAMQELRQASQQVQEELKQADKEGNKERVAELKTKSERLENNMRETKLAFQKFISDQSAEKKAAEEKKLAERKKQAAQQPGEKQRDTDPVKPEDELRRDRVQYQPNPERSRQDRVVEQAVPRGDVIRPNVQRIEQMRQSERLLREAGFEDLANEVGNRANRWEAGMRQQGEAAAGQRREAEVQADRAREMETRRKMESQREMERVREQERQQREAQAQREQAMRRQADEMQARQREMEQRFRAERENAERELQRARGELDRELQRLRSEFSRGPESRPADRRGPDQPPMPPGGINPQRIGNALGELKGMLESLHGDVQKLRREVNQLKQLVKEDLEEDREEDPLLPRLLPRRPHDDDDDDSAEDGEDDRG